MIRVLTLIAVVGFFVSVACLSAAAAVGGRDLAEHGWAFPEGWHIKFDGEHDRDADDADDADGATKTRQIAWTGGGKVTLDAPVSIRYVQAPGPAKLEISGPARVVDDVNVGEDGQIDVDASTHAARQVSLVLTAPDVSRFELNNKGRLTVENYDQDRLELEMSGRSSADVSGRAKSFVLTMSGRGEADLGRLQAADGRVEISGAGEAIIAPTASADLEVSGDGRVDLKTHPAVLHTDFSGGGRLTQAGPPAPPALPEAPPPPKVAKR
ncbi:MAG TPA: DUF2807 domain-containing protein [Caulobacteraceae bacterium]|nr:DUF2807 domain-containing protein [Caulobacteraceae bacterium]